jgi:hypothetical protein
MRKVKENIRIFDKALNGEIAQDAHNFVKMQ